MWDQGGILAGFVNHSTAQNREFEKKKNDLIKQGGRPELTTYSEPLIT